MTAALALSCAGLIACGGGSHKAGSGASPGTAPASQASLAPPPGPLAPHGSPAPDTVVATVEGHRIKLGEALHWIATSGPVEQEVPVPPDYADCVARLGARSGSQGSAVLKDTCRHQYEEMLTSGLQALIHTRWLLGQSREEGVTVDRHALSAELAQAIKLGKKAHQTLASTGQSLGDLKLKLALGQLSNGLYERVERSIPKVSGAQIARYYKAHEKSFALPEERDLQIIRTTTEAGAQKALAAIRAGRSFASVVKESATRQPIYSIDGLVRGLKANVYSEPVLNDAIFSARPKVLSGPVKISLGFYVFEVLRIHPPHQATLAQVSGQIAALLPQALHDETLSSYVKAFRAKWTARTDCRAGYVVEGCRQYKGPKGVQDAYTI